MGAPLVETHQHREVGIENPTEVVMRGSRLRQAQERLVPPEEGRPTNGGPPVVSWVTGVPSPPMRAGSQGLGEHVTRFHVVVLGGGPGGRTSRDSGGAGAVNAWRSSSASMSWAACG